MYFWLKCISLEIKQLGLQMGHRFNLILIFIKWKVFVWNWHNCADFENLAQDIKQFYSNEIATSCIPNFATIKKEFFFSFFFSNLPYSMHQCEANYCTNLRGRKDGYTKTKQIYFCSYLPKPKLRNIIFVPIAKTRKTIVCSYTPCALNWLLKS